MSAIHTFAVVHNQTTAAPQQALDPSVALGIAAQLSRLSAKLASEDLIAEVEVLPIALRMICRLFPDVSSASLVRYRGTGRTLVACSNPEASWLDTLQDSLGDGPCWDAHDLDMLTVMSSWLGEKRWQRLAAQLPDQPDIGSLVSVPLTAGGHSRLVLNIYARLPGTFDGAALHIVTLAAAGLALAITALREREQIENLKAALGSNRRIGAAIGIIMASLHCTEDEAFTMLRTVSQHTHLKLRSVADEVLYTGALPKLSSHATVLRTV
jgi:GAF domain-containing protein